MKTEKQVVITGGNGFIGSYIAKAFYNAGCKVIIISSGSNAGSSAGEYYMIHADITDEHFMETVCSEIKHCDVLVHAAADLGQTAEAITVNVKGSWSVFNLALRLQCPNIIYMSSVPVIGIPHVLPVTESHPVAPASIYHATKYFGEELLALPVFNKMNRCVLRIPAPIGPGMNVGRILPVFIKACIDNKKITIAGHGSRIQNYIDVRDIANSAVLASEYLAKEKAVREIFIIGGHSVSNIDLARMCVEVMGSASEIVFSGQDDPEENMKWILSCEKSYIKLGFKPDISLENSILDIGRFIQGSQLCD